MGWLPAAIGAGVSLFNGISSANTARKQQNAANAAAAENAKTQDLYRQQIMQALGTGNTLAQSAGEAQALASAPAYQGISDPNSQANIEGQAQTYRDDSARTANNAAGALTYALTGGGFGVRGSSGIGAGLGSIYSNAQQNNAKAEQALQYQGGQNRYTNAVNAENTRFSRLSSLLQSALNVGNTATQGIGGLSNAGLNLQSMAQNNANNAGQGVANSFGAIGKYVDSLNLGGNNTKKPTNPTKNINDWSSISLDPTTQQA